MDSYVASGKDKTDFKLAQRAKAVETFCSLPIGSRVLTFPGDNYLTEFATLKRRPDLNLYCVENKSAIFFKGLRLQSQFRQQNSIPSNSLVSYNYDFDAMSWDLERGIHGTFGAAWIDFIGGVTPDRLASIKSLWKNIDTTLILTLSYRTCHSNLSELMKCSGGMVMYFSKELSSSKVVQEYKYKHAGRGQSFHHMEFKKEK